ncbi:hypothetical protein C0J52_19026, partial [Blattella germanica]
VPFELSPILTAKKKDTITIFLIQIVVLQNIGLLDNSVGNDIFFETPYNSSFLSDHKTSTSRYTAKAVPFENELYVMDKTWLEVKRLANSAMEKLH